MSIIGDTVRLDTKARTIYMFSIRNPLWLSCSGPNHEMQKSTQSIDEWVQWLNLFTRDVLQSHFWVPSYSNFLSMI